MSVPGRRPVRAWLARRGARAVTSAGLLALALLRRLGPSPRRMPADARLSILLTATFYSDNWIASHLRPLAASRRCGRVRLVAVQPVPTLPGVEACYPPRWLRRLVGGVPARLMWFAVQAVRTRPDVVGGFHLLFNGMAAALLARATGARSLYFCVGGVTEMDRGGFASENRLFGLQERPDLVVERRLVRFVDACDLVITMGSVAAAGLRSRGVEAPIEVLPGGIDAAAFGGPTGPPGHDLVFVGRLAPVKRVDLYLRAVAAVARERPSVRALVVGDGALRADLEALARALGLAENVLFTGHQADVGSWLRRARIFVLTSDSEGLPLAVMEAMTCGLPAVVSAVGDLPDLIEDGVNGFLVHARTPDAFARPLLSLLDDLQRLAAASKAARATAARYETGAATERWDVVLGRFSPVEATQ